MSTFTGAAKTLWDNRVETLIILTLIVPIVCLFVAMDRRESIPTVYNMSIYEECMAAVPPGPQSTHYNDLVEIVQECKWMAREKRKARGEQ